MEQSILAAGASNQMVVVQTGSVLRSHRSRLSSLPSSLDPRTLDVR